MKENNKNNYIELLNTNNPIIIKETLKKIQIDGDIDIIPSLFELLVKYKNEEIGNTTLNILKDIKLSKFKNYILDNINNPKYSKIKTNLLSICWESSIDFSDNLNIFAEIIIEDDFINSFEAYTIIKNLNYDSNMDSTKEVIEYFKSNIQSINSQKKELIYDLIKFLEKQIDIQI